MGIGGIRQAQKFAAIDYRARRQGLSLSAELVCVRHQVQKRKFKNIQLCDVCGRRKLRQVQTSEQ